MFGLQNQDKISRHQKVVHSPTQLSYVAALPSENNSSDAVCQIVDHTHNISTGSSQSYPLYYWGRLLSFHLTEHCRQDTLYIKVIWILISLCTGEIIRHIYYNNCHTLQTKLHKVVRRHYSGEVSEFTTSWCKIFSGFGIPKSIKIGSFFCRVIQNIEMGRFIETHCTTN